MSWSELERLVQEAEQDGDLRRALRHCRSRTELVLAARRLDYRITRADLHGAWLLDGRGQPPCLSPATAERHPGQGSSRWAPPLTSPPSCTPAS